MYDFIEIDDVNCLKETEKAILILADNEELWVPKSVVGEDSEVQGEGDSGTLVVADWFARKAGLE